MKYAIRLLTLALVAGLVVVPRPALAASHTVTDLGDTGAPGQLRTLIDAAAAGDTIQIPAGTIVLTGAAYEGANASGDLDVNKDLAFIGAGAGVTVIDGGLVDRVFELFPGTTVIIQDLTIRNGSIPELPPFSAPGGGIYAQGDLKLVNAVVEDCFGWGGGGIMNTGNLAIENSSIRNNVSDGITANGGGIANLGTAYVTRSTISGNQVIGTSASAQGGGIISIGAMTIENSTVSGNGNTGVMGGGIYVFNSTLHLNNVTVADNTVDTDASGAIGGGGVANGGGATVIEMSNTLIAGNRRGGHGLGHTADDCLGDLTSLGHNLIEEPTCTVLTPSSDLLGVRAKIRPLASNGGPTETHALKNSSPAVDAGDDALCPSTDQRGETRPLDGDRDHVAVCDIGAFELRR